MIAAMFWGRSAEQISKADPDLSPVDTDPDLNREPPCTGILGAFSKVVSAINGTTILKLIACLACVAAAVILHPGVIPGTLVIVIGWALIALVGGAKREAVPEPAPGHESRLPEAVVSDCSNAQSSFYGDGNWGAGDENLYGQNPDTEGPEDYLED